MAEIHLGVLMVAEGVELLDCAPVGLFDEMSKSYLKNLDDMLCTAEFRDNSPNIIFHWVGEGSKCSATASAAINLTNDFHNCPQLDILLIPGPNPFTYNVNEATKKFLHSQIEGGLYALLTVCSGIMPPLQAGILNGKQVTCPRFLIPVFQPQHPAVKFREYRWVTDVTGPLPAHAALKKPDAVCLRHFDREKNGTEIWTSGQVLNGLDMVAHFIKTKFPVEYADWVMAGSDCPQRAQEY